MKLRILFTLILLTTVLGTTPALADDSLAANYDYPINNNLAATVIGTPEKYRVEFTHVRKSRSEKKLRYDKNRNVPEIYWHSKGLNYTLVSQSGPAPLLISIAGTGGSNRTKILRIIERVFYAQGYHILSLPSPTHSDFIVNSSTSHLPGLPEDDARDLYRVMKDVVKKISQNIEITHYNLIGYSLGGTQAAFLAKLDVTQRVFNFKRVLMLNPSVNLYNSVAIFDKMFANRFANEREIQPFFDKIINSFAHIMDQEDFTGLTSHALYQAFKEDSPSDRDLQGMISMAFRISLANMIFAADTMSKSGYIVPANYEIPKYSSVTNLYKVAMRQSFTDYFNQMVYPHYKDRFSTSEAMIKATDLKIIEDFLLNAQHIGLITNVDDIIYAPGEIEFLRNTFGQRATIFPNGGHLGNISSRAYVNEMINFFGKAKQ